MNFNPASLRNTLLHTKIMEWTNDDALELIEQYRSHTELWNRADPKYKDKLCRFRAWSEIAERFGCSKAEVERKMNVLLTQYRREKHKMLVKLYQGIQPNPSKWYAFKRFDFMEAGGGSASAIVAGIAGGGSGGVGGVGGGGGSVGGSGNGIGLAGSSGVGGSIAAGLVSSMNSSNSNNSGNSIITNGHHSTSQHHHHQHQHGQQLHHHHHSSHHAAAAAAAAAAALNGLAATASGGYNTVAAAAPTTSHHRRMKTKEMKYFGAMSLNLPMLLTNPQPIDSWNPVSQFSPPPTMDRSQLRVPLPMSFSAASSQNDLNTSGGAASIGGGSSLGGGGSGNGGRRSLFEGSSNNSDYDDSPHKPMDTTDDNDDDDGADNNDSKNDESVKCECPTSATPSNLQHDSSINSNDGRLSRGPNDTPGANGSANNCSGNVSTSSGGGGGGGGGGSVIGSGGSGGIGRRSDGNSGTDAGSSPIPNTNTFEAHKQRHLMPGVAVATSSRGDPHSDDLDIKQELLENYFHAPHPPAPPGSHRSYSSTDENRHGAESADDFAQDLRMNAAAAAAAKGLDFSRFVLPPNLRRSTDSIDEKFSPINMRKLNTASASSSAAGQMLLNSLISSESMSEDNNTSISDSAGRLDEKPGINGNSNGLNGGNSQDASSSAAAAAAAAALYAESLNKDDCDFIGSNVSVKLRTMDRTQRIIAEKLISEVLYYGQFNELERSARIQPK